MRASLLLLPCLLVAMACGGGGDASGTATDAADEPDGTSREASDNSTPRPPADIAGTYSVTGTNPDGSAYEGALTVTTRGSVYQFSWATGNDYEGVGVVDGNTVAVGWGGPECGAVLYRMADDGSLQGQWALYENESAGTETARRVTDSGAPAGSYLVNGTNPDGSSYTGNLDVTAAGDSYRLAWEAGGVGQGIVLDDMFGSSYGGEACGVAVYRVSGNTLDGTWTTYGDGAIGTERAVGQ
jgi:hypothetical protein